MAIPDMLVYSIKIQWVLVWFPIARGAQIDRPFFNVGTFAYRSSDPTFEVTGPQFLLTEPDAERLEGVQATMDVDVDDDALFSIRLDRMYRLGQRAHDDKGQAGLLVSRSCSTSRLKMGSATKELP